MIDLAPFPANSQPLSNYVPRRSMFDPLGNVSTSGFAQQHKTQLAEPLLAFPSQRLLDSLEKRPVGPSGLFLNDHEIPRQLTDWQTRGGFWGRVAGYYILKHQGAATLYRSPFSAMVPQANDGTLAERYYESLEPEQRERIDDEAMGLKLEGDVS